MKKLPPMGLIIDRHNIAEVTPLFVELGGAYLEMFEMWKRLSPMRFLVLLAHTQKRLRLRAPLTAMCVDEAALRASLLNFIQQIDGLTMKWIMHMQEGSAAQSIVRAELLRDASPVGVA